MISSPLNSRCGHFESILVRDLQYTLFLIIVPRSIFYFFFSRRDASERETSRMNQRSYRLRKKTSARLGSCMQMRTGKGAPEFRWEAFRCAFPRKRVVARYASPEAQLFDFRQNSFSKIAVSFVKDVCCIIRVRLSNRERKKSTRQRKWSNP